MARKSTTVAEREGEFDTAQIKRIRGVLYYGIANGGARGAWDRQCGDGVWRDHAVQAFEPIDEREAVAMLLDWGYADEEIERLLGDVG